MANCSFVPGDPSRYRHLAAMKDCADIAHSRSSFVQNSTSDRLLNFASRSTPMSLDALGRSWGPTAVRSSLTVHVARWCESTPAKQCPNRVLRNWLLGPLLGDKLTATLLWRAKPIADDQTTPVTIGCTGVLKSICPDGQSFVRTR